MEDKLMFGILSYCIFTMVIIGIICRLETEMNNGYIGLLAIGLFFRFLYEDLKRDE